ncbi:Na+/H+ antiporter NhaA [Pseudosulfitobacter pseudonitzschiae]|uniref:Na+/H+ antiporter NhaA n=1 Tax=Pseudosulfitobacter pseudonitzschiae TaxID=1402135 RepID=UPI001AF84AFE|nr:Na+/H+ antiporter NhaA [Pseudosulfitobacter pseudonitzschiae]MBM1815015.1 Na+/H+ antiporter NhaA [Pseudosulfitobacter pseudonitzschiae]MBM1832006.1 Na+/H+ antiporter NhaA [Pseudosulfitobacter pseudonitzschiae]MBM1836874.1 Na+/H+ antiporter NhaA [Pseudosulfitobacter pseudonitzschiae]MBM1841720.1 Na+/H+ antiporter NhaA [Pseudosulfitobacter pseudonitzschiae]MBM1846588.1 Na+/H+ antiporter NhaA [Pseudosulfitobacter pseudonitzschiae]
MYRVWSFLTNYSLLLIVGALIALVWANIDADSYHHFIHLALWDHAPIGHLHPAADGHEAYRTLTLHYLVNDLLMALFFAIAAKEVWEAVILRNGSLRGKKAATPLIATLGGMLGPVTVYLGLAMIIGSSTFDAVANGWAIPTATDIAFSYLVGRIVFGAGHPAVRFLLLLAIADDAAGLIILAVFYPSGQLAPEWLLLSLVAAVGVFLLFNWLPRRIDRGNQDRSASTWVRTKLTFIPYLLAGCASWYGFMAAGLHPALGLLPIVPTIPHADRAFGLFSEAEQYLTDLLNQMEHALKHPVEIILFFFGLLNAGVAFSSIGEATWLVLFGLLLGKPAGIFLFGWIAARPLGLGIPEGMRIIDLLVVGCVAAIGFTVSLFIAAVAFDAGPVQDAAKMGALFSFAAAIISIMAGKLLRVQKQQM